MAVQTTVADKDSKPARDTIRQEFNKLLAITRYLALNGVASTTVAATPLCARGTTASKVKTTNATVLRNSGALNALGATDDFWTLTGGNIAIGYARRYLLCASAADAASVIASDDQLIASVASCRFPLPADGIAIVGILTILNATNAFIPGTTLLSAAGVTDSYIDAIDESVFNVSQVLP